MRPSIYALSDHARAVALLETAHLPAADLPSEVASFFVAGEADAPAGLVGLELHGSHALLRSLVVVPSARSKGLGSALVEHAERHASEHAVRSIYLLTTTAEEFFVARGYTRAARESAPQAIRSTREFAGLCPASAVLMTKTLEENVR